MPNREPSLHRMIIENLYRLTLSNPLPRGILLPISALGGAIYGHSVAYLIGGPHWTLDIDEKNTTARDIQLKLGQYYS
jgi:hypothetical protein